MRRGLLSTMVLLLAIAMPAQAGGEMPMRRAGAPRPDVSQLEHRIEAMQQRLDALRRQMGEAGQPEQPGPGPRGERQPRQQPGAGEPGAQRPRLRRQNEPSPQHEPRRGAMFGPGRFGRAMQAGPARMPRFLAMRMWLRERMQQHGMGMGHRGEARRGGGGREIGPRPLPPHRPERARRGGGPPPRGRGDRDAAVVV